jgi:hypothetical protein
MKNRQTADGSGDGGGDGGAAAASGCVRLVT